MREEEIERNGKRAPRGSGGDLGRRVLKRAAAARVNDRERATSERYRRRRWNEVPLDFKTVVVVPFCFQSHGWKQSSHDAALRS